MSQCNSPQKITFLNPSEWRIWLLSFQNFLRWGGGGPSKKPPLGPPKPHPSHVIFQWVFLFFFAWCSHLWEQHYVYCCSNIISKTRIFVNVKISYFFFRRHSIDTSTKSSGFSGLSSIEFVQGASIQARITPKFTSLHSKGLFTFPFCFYLI